MLPDNIDDLFRQQLDGHATTPPADLWARLQAAQQPEAPTEPLDAQFRAALDGHATPPRREVWERLEDEHLRPRLRRQRPVVLWWQFAAAALLLFTLLGGGLWRGGFLGHPVGDIVTTEKAPTQPNPANNSTLPTDNQAAAIPQTEVATAAPEKNQKNVIAQATGPAASPSSTPIARTTRPRRPATAPAGSPGAHLQGQRPDAAAALLARTGGRKTPADQPLPHLPETTLPTPNTSKDSPVLAAVTTPAAPQVIEVEVRRGRPTPATAPTVVAVAVAEPTPARRPRLRLGGLLRQADHLVHGEAVSLAEATGLPENATVQVRLGGRVLSRSIQL